MGRYLLGFVTALLILGTASLPAGAQAKSNIVVYNSSDAWAWVTAYSSGIIKGAWCTDPGKYSSRQFSNGITSLRVEATHKNCAHPVMLDRSFKPASNAGTNAHLRGKNGRYTWTPQ
ncbi:MAG TPA: hypothetical protein VMB20_09370 [Candidatus Acidoferrum sp.]|nr:hypothetical protein [Candidatus Acidoferrum sp.]